MGLIIKPTEEKKILISGTEIELDSVYARILFNANLDGKTMEIGYHLFINKSQFLEGKIINTSIPVTSFKAELQEGEEQTIEQAQISCKVGFEQLGFSAEIEV